MKRFLALIMCIVLVALSITSCNNEETKLDFCEYKTERNTEGRNVGYVEMKIKGYGKVVFLLDHTTAPKTVERFVGLVKGGYYDTPEAGDERLHGNTFHIVQPDWVIQGGCYNKNGTSTSDKELFGEFANNGWENDISLKRGVISMVRGNDYNSASYQFFICHKDLPELDGQYAAFGYVIEGMNVIDKVIEDYVEHANTEMAYIIEDAKFQPQIEYFRWIKTWDGEHS
ncbi:MAG: peptidylprolyl isomerase [Clostridia bacterium]|nr:peptidylprolyl isomerase [Clostridia bacterium]